jgi:hypothetical protein
MFDHDPEVKVLKKEYGAGPFPRWNCWIKDPWLARGLVSELELFLGARCEGGGAGVAPIGANLEQSVSRDSGLAVNDELVGAL